MVELYKPTRAAAPCTLDQLLTHVKSRRTQVLASFSGQGHTYIEELQRLVNDYPCVNQLMLTVKTDLMESGMELGVHQSEILNPFMVLQENGSHLARPSISCPMISLTQLATVLVTLNANDWNILDLQKSIAGVTGHSQGIIAAAVFASSRSSIDFMKNAATAVTLLWLVGCQLDNVHGSMALLQNTTRASINSILDKFEDIAIAGQNTPGTYILTGSKPSLEDLQQRVTKQDLPEMLGSSFKFLDIEAPFHSPLLALALPKILANVAILKLGFGPLRLPLFWGSECLDEPSPQRLVQLICNSEIEWPATLNAKAWGLLVDFGPGPPPPMDDKLRMSLPCLRAGVTVNTKGQKLPTADLLANYSTPLCPSVVESDKPDKSLNCVLPTLLTSQTGKISGSCPHPFRQVILEETKRILGVDTVSSSESFFSLGLNSNSIVTLAAAIEAKCGQFIPVTTIFDFPTAELLATRIAPLCPSVVESDKPDKSLKCARPTLLTSRARKISGSRPNHLKQIILEETKRILDVNIVSSSESFFSLGLNSNSIVKLAAAIEAKCGQTVPVTTIFDFPTADLLANYLAPMCPFAPESDKSDKLSKCGESKHAQCNKHEKSSTREETTKVIQLGKEDDLGEETEQRQEQRQKMRALAERKGWLKGEREDKFKERVDATLRVMTKDRTLQVLDELLEGFSKTEFQEKLSQLVSKDSVLVEGRKELAFTVQHDVLLRHGLSPDDEGLLALKCAARAYVNEPLIIEKQAAIKQKLRIP